MVARIQAYNGLQSTNVTPLWAIIVLPTILKYPHKES